MSVGLNIGRTKRNLWTKGKMVLGAGLTAMALAISAFAFLPSDITRAVDAACVVSNEAELSVAMANSPACDSEILISGTSNNGQGLQLTTDFDGGGRTFFVASGNYGFKVDDSYCYGAGCSNSSSTIAISNVNLVGEGGSKGLLNLYSANTIALNNVTTNGGWYAMATKAVRVLNLNNFAYSNGAVLLDYDIANNSLDLNSTGTFSSSASVAVNFGSRSTNATTIDFTDSESVRTSGAIYANDAKDVLEFTIKDGCGAAKKAISDGSAVNFNNLDNGFCTTKITANGNVNLHVVLPNGDEEVFTTPFQNLTKKNKFDPANVEGKYTFYLTNNFGTRSADYTVTNDLNAPALAGVTANGTLLALTGTPTPVNSENGVTISAVCTDMLSPNTTSYITFGEWTPAGDNRIAGSSITIPSDRLVSGNTYEVKIECSDLYNYSALNKAEYTVSFTVDNEPPTLFLTQGAGADLSKHPIIAAGSYFDPNNSLASSAGNAVYVNKSDNSDALYIVTPNGLKGPFDSRTGFGPDFFANNGGDGEYCFYSVDLAKNESDHYCFNVDTTAPTIENISVPRYTNNPIITVTGTVYDVDLDYYRCTVYDEANSNGLGNIINYYDRQYSSVTNGDLCTIDLSALGDGTYSIRVVAHDKSGHSNINGYTGYKTTIDTTAPVIDNIKIYGTKHELVAYEKEDYSGNICLEFDAADALLSTVTATIAGRAVTNVSNTGGNHYQACVRFGDLSGVPEGGIAFEIVATDSLGNAANATITSDGSAVIVDKTAPDGTVTWNIITTCDLLPSPYCEATLTTDEWVKDIAGWTRDVFDNKVFTKTFYADETGAVTIIDRAGNTFDVDYSIKTPVPPNTNNPGPGFGDGSSSANNTPVTPGATTVRRIYATANNTAATDSNESARTAEPANTTATTKKETGEVLGARSEKEWSVVNLILTIGAVVIGIVLLASNKFKSSLRVAGLILAVVAVVAFLLTEDWTLSVTWFDGWSILMAIIAAVQVALLVSARNSSTK